MANTLVQFFHWYLPSEGTFWNHAASQADHLSHLGINMAWLPPAYKSSDGDAGVGYAAYDLYDLGEFDQKGSVRTRYGTKDEYLNVIQKFKEKNIKTIVDIVLNHKCGADELEKVQVQEANPDDRNLTIGEPFDKEVYTKFTFPNRQAKYSDFIWDFNCFTGVGDQEFYDKFYLIKHEHGEGWEELVSKEHGNFDYLMGADVEFRNPFVREELKKWIEWYHNLTGFEGMRFDAVKHFSPVFIIEFINFIKSKDPYLYSIAEYWSFNLDELLQYLETVQYNVKLFDAPLHCNFHKASISDNSYDMRTIFNDSLLQQKPESAVTFVENHDTQPLQALESPVDYWFKALAYALILLREAGEPCVFYSCLYGANYKDKGPDGNDHHVELAGVLGLPEMLLIRKNFHDGMLIDYFDHPNTIGWVKRNEAMNTTFGVLMTNGEAGEKGMEFGSAFAGKELVDAMSIRSEVISIDENGWANVFVNEKSVSVWVLKEMMHAIKN